MVKNFKSLLCVGILLLTAVFNVYSQTNTQENQTVNATVNSAFENNTDYFAENPAATDSANTYKAPSAAKMIIKMIVVLALVIAALYGIMLFFKKKNNAVQSEDDFLRRVSSLNLSPGKSIEIITLVDKGYILGVTDGSINLISEITDPEMISALNVNFDKKQNTKKPMNFNEVLEMFLPANRRNNGSIYEQNTNATESNPQNEES